MKNIFCTWKTLFSIGFLVLQSNVIATASDSVRGKLTPRRAAINMLHYDLDLRLNLKDSTLAGVVTGKFMLDKPVDSLQLDLDARWRVQGVRLNDQPVTISRVGNTVRFAAKSLLKSTPNKWTVEYAGKPMVSKNPPWTAGFVFKQDNAGKPWIGVACEGEGASTWWPCKDHPSDEPEEGVTQTAHYDPNLLYVANGRMIKDEVVNGERATTWKVTKPINLYNVTFNLADYVRIQDTYPGAKGILDLDYYVLRANKEKAEKHFKQAHTMLSAFEDAFGPYPYYEDSYKLVETSYWGMEHQSCVAYGNNYKNNGYGFDFILVHESGHEWWGNQVSVSDHADLWIHESFCTYSELVLLERMDSTRVKDYLKSWRRQIGNNEPMVGPYGVGYSGWQDNDIYHKGAMLIHTMRQMMGDDKVFRSLLRQYATSTNHVPTSTADCLEWWAKEVDKLPAKPVKGSVLKQFMREILTTTNLPKLEIQEDKGVLKARLVYNVPGLEIPITWADGSGRLFKKLVGTAWVTIGPVSNGYKSDLSAVLVTR